MTQFVMIKSKIQVQAQDTFKYWTVFPNKVLIVICVDSQVATTLVTNTVSSTQFILIDKV